MEPQTFYKDGFSYASLAYLVEQGYDLEVMERDYITDDHGHIYENETLYVRVIKLTGYPGRAKDVTNLVARIVHESGDCDCTQCYTPKPYKINFSK